jgi:hypothetical protein
MKRIQITTVLATIACILVLSTAPGWNTEDDVEKSLALQQEIIEEADLAAISYSLTSESARELVGADSIEKRPQSFGISGPMTELVFREYSDAEAETRLSKMAALFIGAETKAEIVDNGSSMALPLEKGFAYVSKSSGAFAVGIHDTEMEPIVVENAEEAVNLALEQIANLDILDLAIDESLDVIAISSTHYAGWHENEQGETVPLYLSVEGSSEPVTEFKSSYKVVFGRRYRGVPIIDSKLVVRLDHKGRLASFKRRWRDIDEEMSNASKPVELLSDSEILASQTLANEEDFELDGVQCGYVEASASGYAQSSAGVGCKYYYYNEKEKGTLAGGRAEWVNIAADGEAIPLKGEKLSFQSDEN